MSLRLARALVRAVIELIEWSPRMTYAQKYAHVEALTSALRELELESESARKATDTMRVARCATENHRWNELDHGTIICDRCGARPGEGGSSS